MKFANVLFIVLSLSFSVCANVHASRKVLIIVSNIVDMGDSEKHDARNNLWEVAPPYHIFLSHGFEVDFSSPQGGKVEFNMDPLGISSYTIEYENFLGKANSSLAPKDVNVSDYWAVYIGGGYGPLFDVANNRELQSIIAKIYEAGGVVGGGGHGSGAFANVKLSSAAHVAKEIIGLHREEQ